MSFRRRNFPEILDGLLTSITKGIAGESHPFPPNEDGPPYRHHLLKAPVSEIVSVYGSLSDKSHLFREDVDYRLSDDNRSLLWLENGESPDDGTIVNVNYRPESARPHLTDTQVGSVVRTLAESVALEIASMYAQMESVYDAGFIDLASGRSLDHVVALLGIERIESGRASGDIEFTRAPYFSGAMSIPSGTRVMSRDGSAEYETTADAMLLPGQNKAIVNARSIECDAPVRANELTALKIPIYGIASVDNPAPTAISINDEPDEQLRARAKGLMHGSERATLGAMRHAISMQGVSAEVVESSTPGHVEITVRDFNISPDQMQKLLTAIEESRPAGVAVKLNLPNAHSADMEPHAIAARELPIDIPTTLGQRKPNHSEPQNEVDCG